MQKTFDITLSETEAQALLTLLHLAVKTAGLEGPHAANAVHFQAKINAAFEASKVKAPVALPTAE